MNSIYLHWKKAILPTLFFLLISAIGMTKALAQEFTLGDLNYSINDELSVTVTGHVNGPNAIGDLVIPENVSYEGNTYIVTAIGDNAFYDHNGLVGSLVIPNSVTEIGYAAFSGCSGFNGTLTLGNSLTTIGSHAFEGCSGFTGDLVIPNSVSILGGEYLSWGWDWRESYAFSGCSGFNGTLTLSNSLNAIGCGCFMGCSGFTGDLVIPNTVTQIGYSWGNCEDGAFEGCSGFTGDLTILGETEIGPYSFSGCSGFSGLTLGAFIIGIYDYAFYGCEGFASITALGTGGWIEGDMESIFIGVNTDIPVYVVCGDLDNFQYNPVWSSFTNFQEMDPCQWEVLATADPPQGGSVSGSGLFVYQEQANGDYLINVDLCATPNEGYSFYHWTDDFEWNEWDSLSSCYNGSIRTDYTYHRHYVANFRPSINEVTAVANIVGGGTVTGGGVYDFGTECTLTASANEGYLFVDWTENGRHVSYDTSYSFVVTEGRNLVANFREGYGCDIIFDFYDEYGDGWNGNKLVVTDDIGYTYTLTLEEGFSGTQILKLVQGSHIALTWIKNNWVFECSFTVSYSDGTEICQASDLNNNFLYEFDMDCGEMQLPLINITAITNPAEGGTVSGGGEYEYGTECTLTATANDNYTFTNWTRNGQVVSTDATYSFNVIAAPATYVANFSTGNYEITATTTPPGAGNITGAGSFALGDSCTLTVTANAGYTFTNWTKNGQVVSTSASYTFTVTESAAYVANFSVNSYSITATVNPSGAGNITGAGTFTYGSSVTLTVTANPGYTFTNWTKNGQVVSTNAIFIFTVTEAATYIANFEQTSYEVTVMSNPTEGGTVTGGGTYSHGSSVTLSATANEGYTFMNWTKDGDVVSNSPNYTITVTEASTYVANFQINSYEITVTANPTDGGTVTGGGVYVYGATVTLTASAAEGYTFVNWTKDGDVISNSPSYAITVTEAATYVANFQINSYEIAVTANPTEGGTVTGGGTYIHGASVTLTATAAEGYTFVNWTKDNVEVSTEATYSFTVTEDASYMANFIESQGEVTQETEFSEGYTWWSTYIEQEGIEGLEMLEEGLGDNGITIYSQANGFTNYYEDYGWWGSLSSIDNMSSYKIKTIEPCSVALTGDEAVPSQHPITLSYGWTWIGYVSSTALDVNEALSGLEATVGDKLKSQEGYSEYYAGYGWYGSLSTIDPGTGLMYYSSNGDPVTFTYPDNGRGGELKQNLTSEHNHWKPNIYAYPDNMTVMAVVELNDEELGNENYELAAFASNGECRGSVRLIFAEPLHRHVAFLTISGKDAAELSFRLYDTETGEEYDAAEESLSFVANALVGDADDLYTIHFRGTTGVDELANKVQVYPNPVNAGEQFIISIADDVKTPVRVEIVNALGVETLCAMSEQTPVNIVAPTTSGVYTLRITVEGKGTVFRKLVVK